MASINLYKIDKNKSNDFFEKVKEKFKKPKKTIKLGNDKLSLYFSKREKEVKVSWDWVFEFFDEEPLFTNKSPYGFILIERGDSIYALSFSYAYYIIDQFSDHDFTFDFARRLNYKKVKTTALTNPNSQRNKTVNTYIDYEVIDFDSGESLSKIKAAIYLEDNFELFTENLEIGNSIKFSVKNPSLKKIQRIIEYVENVIANDEETVKIPLYSRIKDQKLLDELDKDLSSKINNDKYTIEFSEYEIYATNIVFNTNDEYEISYKGIKKKINTICFNELKLFCEEKGLELGEIIFNAKIIVYRDGHRIYTEKLINLVFYTNEEQQAILSKGEWFQYNDDYLNYLRDSISEISAIYDESYNYSSIEHQKFIEEKYNEVKNNSNYIGLEKNEIERKLKMKFYKENYFNTTLESKGFKCLDREINSVKKHKYEVADLYKDNTLYTVKIGNSSGKLSYAVDQSLIAIDLIKKKSIEFNDNLDKVCLWFVLDRKNELSIKKDDNVNLDEMEMIILKNKIDHWKKEVRLKGYVPEIRINYVKS